MHADIGGASPLFIVKDVPAALAFYRDSLGFAITFEGPEPADIFFGIVQRGAAMIMFKAVGVDPVPNYTRDVKQGIARWDAYVYVPDPDALAAEFASRGVKFFEPLADNHDGLRGFELQDADGYVLFFGRPIPTRQAGFMSQQVTVELLKGFLDAFNRHDLDAIMTYFADDCVFYMPRGSTPRGNQFVGKAEVRAGLAKRFSGIPDVHYGEDRHWAGDDFGVSEWTLTGTTTSGQRLEVRGIDLLEFADGKITRKDSFWKIRE